MSWLSNLFGGGGEDPEAVRQRAEIAAKQANDRALQMQIDYLNQVRAEQNAKEAVQQAKAEAIDPTQTRNDAMRIANSVFVPDFQNRDLPNTFSDDVKNAVYGEQRGEADAYINNLLKRGIFTDTGYAAAKANLDKQGAKVRGSLDDISNTLLNAERDRVGAIGDRSRQVASNLNVGDTFDISPFQKEYSDELTSFGKGFGDKFRAAVPEGLFDTKSLAAIGGGAQGAGNQPFDPAALAGTNIPLAGTGGTTTTEDPFAPAKKPERPTTVF